MSYQDCENFRLRRHRMSLVSIDIDSDMPMVRIQSGSTLEDIIGDYCRRNDPTLFDLHVLLEDHCFIHRMHYYLGVASSFSSIKELFPRGGVMHTRLCEGVCHTPDGKESILFTMLCKSFIMDFRITDSRLCERIMYLGGESEMIAKHISKYCQNYRKTAIGSFSKEEKAWKVYAMVKRYEHEMASRIQRFWRERTASPYGVPYQRMVAKYAFRRSFLQ